MDAVEPILDAIASCPRRPLLVAIDGGSATGKTTLAAALAQALACPVVHMDDFFLPPALRTPQRLAEPGGNVHYERVLDQVLRPLQRGEAASYGVFDCSVMDVTRTCTIEPAPVTILEGAYSLHPALADFYGLKIFLRTPPAVQADRILRRNGAVGQAAFLSRWIPMENRYFEAFSIAASCDLILEV